MKVAPVPTEESPRTGARWRIRAKDGERTFEAENDGVFDELVVDQWLHLEQMNDDTWWMRVGDARIDIKVGPDGVAQVSVERGVY